MIIETTEKLQAFCSSLKGAEFVTVDTEFMREKTYWPRLCLVQVAGPNGEAAIDPLSEDIDLSPLFELMADESVMKVFHAARQDLEIFYRAMGQRLPAPLFDTQVAATVCGFGEQVGYEALASRLAGAEIDKSSRFTDWARRPLTEKQIAYALADVTHLRVAYEKLRLDLKVSGREDWVAGEMAALVNPELYSADPSSAWKRLKIRSANPKMLAVARALAAWRESEAQNLNIPRGWVMRDETLMEIAHHAPRNAHDLAKTRGLSAGFSEGRQGTEVLAVIESSLQENDLPAPKAAAGIKRPFGSSSRTAAIVELLKVLLKQAADEHGVAPRIIASTEELEKIAVDDNPDVPAMRGWRLDLFGKKALDLKAGKIALAFDGNNVVAMKISDKCLK